MTASAARAWVAAARPATLTAAVAAVLVGTAMAAAHGKHALGPAFAALLGAVFIQIGTNLYNDYGDFIRGADDHDRLGPDRALQKGWLSAKQVVGGAAVSFGLAAAAGVYLIYVAGFPIVVVGVLSIVSGVLYTGGPKPLAYVGLGDLFVMLFFGVVAVCGTYWVQAHQLTLDVLAASIAVGCLTTAILVVNNLRDRHTDRAAGKRTLVVRFGARFGRAEYATLIALAYAIPVALWLGGRISVWALALPLVSLPLALRELWFVMKRDGAALNAQLRGTARVGLVYAALLSAGVLA